jgi:hypothetical protein
LAAFATIAGLCLFAPQNYGILSFVGVAYLMRTVSSLLGYFDMGHTPVLQLFRLNVTAVALLVITMCQVLVGQVSLNFSVLALMMTNLVDIYFSMTHERQEPCVVNE